MAEANVNDRASVERLYPLDDFERDAAENSDAKATVHRGLRIVTPVDDNGRFGAERGSRHVGESDPEGDTVFLAPFLARLDAPGRQSEGYGGPAPTGDPLDANIQRAQDYRAFVEWIIEAAKGASFKPAIGRHEDRLRGFHGG